MISFECPECGSAYSKQRVPKVLPCGHSICGSCTFEMFESRGFYQCRTCIQKFDYITLNYPLPTNMLFFQAIERIDKFIRQKEWQLGIVKESGQAPDESALLKIEEQCLYTFCQRKKFERDGAIELYCSQQCKKNHEQLQNIPA